MSSRSGTNWWLYLGALGAASFFAYVAYLTKDEEEDGTEDLCDLRLSGGAVLIPYAAAVGIACRG